MATMVVTKQMEQRAKQQDYVWQSLQEMTVMLACQVEKTDYCQHDQGYAGLALPKWQFSSAVKMGVIHGSDLG